MIFAKNYKKYENLLNLCTKNTLVFLDNVYIQFSHQHYFKWNRYYDGWVDAVQKSVFLMHEHNAVSICWNYGDRLQQIAVFCYFGLQFGVTKQHSSWYVHTVNRRRILPARRRKTAGRRFLKWCSIMDTHSHQPTVIGSGEAFWKLIVDTLIIARKLGDRAVKSGFTTMTLIIL